jgi:SAM-dependent methyltransferase
MSTAPRMKPNPAELEAIYSERFDEHIAYRNNVWRVLISEFFNPYVEPNAIVLDLGCGYGEFINNVVCRQKYAMDLNPRAKNYLKEEVILLPQDCSAPWPLPDASLDLVFTSNFFEHLPSKEALSDALTQAARCLRPGKRLVAMGPNIRFVGGAYWNFYDHHLALTDISLVEAMRVHGLRIERVIPRFLPYTMVNRRPVPERLVRLYLKLPLMWRIMGAQFLVIAQKAT